MVYCDVKAVLDGVGAGSQGSGRVNYPMGSGNYVSFPLYYGYYGGGGDETDQICKEGVTVANVAASSGEPVWYRYKSYVY